MLVLQIIISTILLVVVVCEFFRNTLLLTDEENSASDVLGKENLWMYVNLLVCVVLWFPVIHIVQESGVICMPKSATRFLTWSEYRDIWSIIKIKDVHSFRPYGRKVDIQWLLLDVGFQNEDQNLGKGKYNLTWTVSFDGIWWLTTQTEALSVSFIITGKAFWLVKIWGHYCVKWANISQGSVVPCLRCDCIFNDRSVANLQEIVKVEEFWKSACIWWSYA